MTDGTAPPSPEQPHGIEVTLVSGLSGAGRSTAAKVLEDLGWFVVDNLPPELLEGMINLEAERAPDRRRPCTVIVMVKYTPS